MGEPAPARTASGADMQPTGCPDPAVLGSVPFHLSDVPPLPGLDRLQHPAQKHLESDRPRGPSRQPAPVPVTFPGAPSSFRAFSWNGIHPGAGTSGPPPGHQGPEPPAGLKEPLWTPQFPFLLWPPGRLESDASFTCGDCMGLYVLHLYNESPPHLLS